MQAPVAYHPLHLDSLVLDTVLSFNLYTRVAESYVLFRGHDLEFNQRHRDSLVLNGIHTLYVSSGDEGEYGRYVEENIGRLAADPAVPNKKRAELLYSVSKGILLDAFANPRSADIVKRTESVMPHLVDNLVDGRDSLGNMISIMSHDYYTFTHSINVCTFTVALASNAGVSSRQELYDLATGALLHDIGKSEIPKEILNKNGRLTDEEMELMKSHVIRGEKILEGKSGMTLNRMLPVSLHHERLSGKGYPRALVGQQQIHLHGRMTAIADCFDAMTTNRPYARAMDAFEAAQRMKEHLRGDFDPELLAAFIGLLGKAGQGSGGKHS